MDQYSAVRLSRGVGVGSIAIGAGLMSRPGFARVAGLEVRDARMVALTDLIVGVGLVADGPRRSWVLARAGANVGIAAVLLWRGSQTGRVIAAGLGAATIADLQMARALTGRG